MPTTKKSCNGIFFFFSTRIRTCIFSWCFPFTLFLLFHFSLIISTAYAIIQAPDKRKGIMVALKHGIRTKKQVAEKFLENSRLHFYFYTLNRENIILQCALFDMSPSPNHHHPWRERESKEALKTDFSFLSYTQKTSKQTKQNKARFSIFSNITTASSSSSSSR